MLVCFDAFGNAHLISFVSYMIDVVNEVWCTLGLTTTGADGGAPTSWLSFAISQSLFSIHKQGALVACRSSVFG